MKAKKSNERSKTATITPTARTARHIKKLKEYSKLTGRPLEDLIEEALDEYLAANPAKS